MLFSFTVFQQWSISAECSVWLNMHFGFVQFLPNVDSSLIRPAISWFSSKNQIKIKVFILTLVAIAFSQGSCHSNCASPPSGNGTKWTVIFMGQEKLNIFNVKKVDPSGSDDRAIMVSIKVNGTQLCDIQDNGTLSRGGTV